MAARTVPHPLFLASLLAILLGTPAAAQGSAARALDRPGRPGLRGRHRRQVP